MNRALSQLQGADPRDAGRRESNLGVLDWERGGVDAERAPGLGQLLQVPGMANGAGVPLPPGLGILAPKYL